MNFHQAVPFLSLSLSNLVLVYSLEFGSFWHLWFQK